MLADDPAPRLPTTAAERRILGLFGGLLAALLFAEIGSGFSPAKLSVLFALVAWVPLLVLHELGHAGAARLVGWRVSEIVIGFGPELTRFRVGRTRVRLLASPVEGYVVPSPTDIQHARLKAAWIYAAGPGIELAYVGACWFWLGQDLTTRTTDLWLLAVQSSCVAALLGAGFNLLPYASSNSLSDGLGIITSLAADNEGFRSRLVSPFLSEARSELLRENPTKAAQWANYGLQQYPEDRQLRAVSAVCLAAMGDSAKAIERLEALGDLEAAPPEVRVELLLDAAWTVLFANDDALLRDAQGACERALRLCPDHPRGHLLLGRALLARQRAEDAVRQLMTGYKLTRDPDLEAEFVVYLAIGCRVVGNEAHADRFLQEARRRRLPPALEIKLKSQF